MVSVAARMNPRLSKATKDATGVFGTGLGVLSTTDAAVQANEKFSNKEFVQIKPTFTIFSIGLRN